MSRAAMSFTTRAHTGRTSLRAFAFSLLLLLTLVAPPSAACLWDSDTAAAEATGLPEVVDVIAGRFERNPPLFYEMRLARAAARVGADPRALDAYDDAGVSCDRLGRSDDAIGWMARKQPELDGSPSSDPHVREHRYRTLANLGTFHAHRWIRGGARRDDLADLRRSRDLIADAVKLNPDAHFGRERYQLLAIEAALDGVGGAPEDVLPTFLERRDWPDDRRSELRFPHATDANDQLRALGYADAAQGLAGLVVLGNAWESVDVFHALATVLQVDGRSSIAYLAHLRVLELVKQGKGSILPEAPPRERLLQAVGPRTVPILERGIAELDRAYAAARRSADQWSAAREAFMMTRLREGKHPDTHADFWAGFEGGKAPLLPGDGIGERFAEFAIHSPLTTLGSIVAVALCFMFGFPRLARRFVLWRARR